MKKLLAISWAMPPLLLPRSIQVSRTLKCLAEAGWQSTVLCTSTRGLDPKSTIDPSLEAAFPGAFQAERVASQENWLPLKIVERYLLWDHLAWFWRAAARGRKLIASGDFSGIISFAQPWADHLLGLKLHRLSGLPWVAHFSDPWVDSPYARNIPWHRWLSKRLEAAVVREAAAVVFVNSQTADLVMHKYPPAWREKAWVVPHGFDAADFPQVQSAAGAHPRLRLVYTGWFYRGKRTPEALLQGLAILNRTRPLAAQLEVRLIGPYAPDYQPLAQSLGLGEVVACSGPVSFAGSQEAAAAADVLLVIDAPSDRPSLFLPSKLVDYLAFKKPILGLTPQEGASADLLRQLGCPIVAPDDPEAIARAVAALLDLRQAGALTVSPAFAEVAGNYDIRRTTGILARVLRGAVKAAAAPLLPSGSGQR